MKPPAGWPVATVLAGEAAAAAHAVELRNPGGLVVTDGQAVKRMWDRVRSKPGLVSALAGSLPCWLLLADALRRHPTARCAWVRSRRSEEEALPAGYPPSWHGGNARVDEAAKATAREHDVPPPLPSFFRQHIE